MHVLNSKNVKVYICKQHLCLLSWNAQRNCRETDQLSETGTALMTRTWLVEFERVIAHTHGYLWSVHVNIHMNMLLDETIHTTYSNCKWSCWSQCYRLICQVGQVVDSGDTNNLGQCWICMTMLGPRGPLCWSNERSTSDPKVDANTFQNATSVSRRLNLHLNHLNTAPA